MILGHKQVAILAVHQFPEEAIVWYESAGLQQIMAVQQLGET